MTKIQHRKINSDIQGIIYNVDIFSESESIKIILDSLWSKGDKLFFTGMMEESLLDWNETQYLRKYIPEYLLKNGKYHEIERMDDVRFSCCGMIYYDDFSHLFIKKALRYYYSFNFFLPRSLFYWEQFVKDGKSFFQRDVDAIKLFQKDYMNFILIKNLGGESLFLNYRNGFNLPDILNG